MVNSLSSSNERIGYPRQESQQIYTATAEMWVEVWTSGSLPYFENTSYVEYNVE